MFIYNYNAVLLRRDFSENVCSPFACSHVLVQPKTLFIFKTNLHKVTNYISIQLKSYSRTNISFFVWLVTFLFFKSHNVPPSPYSYNLTDSISESSLRLWSDSLAIKSSKFSSRYIVRWLTAACHSRSRRSNAFCGYLLTDIAYAPLPTQTHTKFRNNKINLIK